MLDQIRTNVSDMSDPIQHLPALVGSQRQCLYPVPKERETIPSENCNTLSRKIIVEHWSAVYAAQEIDEKVEVFNSTVLKMLDETIPARE